MKTIFRIMSVLICSAMLLAACAPATPAQPEPAATKAPAATESAAATTAPAAPSGEKVTLDVWVFEGESATFTSLVAAYNAEHPNIEVVITDFPESDYETKIDTALIAGEPPEIGFVHTPKWIKSGAFLALDDMIAQKGIKTADFNQGAWGRDCLVEGKIYCVGTYTGTILLFYNKDIFDKAGVAYPSTTVPMTMDEYVDMCAKITTKSDDVNKRVWGCDADVPVWWQDWRNFIGEDGHKIEGFVNDAATIHVFDDLVKLRADGSVISASDSASLEGTDLLATGKLASTIVDNVIAISTLEKAGINWGAALVPVEKAGDKAWVTGWTDGYGVFSKSKHPKEAQDFLAYFATKGQEARLTAGDLPLDMSYADQWAGDSKGRKESIEAIKLAYPNLFVPAYWDVIGPLWDAFNVGMIEDKRPAKDVLDELAPTMQKTLDQAWETWNTIKP